MSSVRFEDTDSTLIEEIRSKRSRCSNFTSQEKNVLIHIIEKYEDTVELKKTDKQTILKKLKVWDTVADEFNDILGLETLRTSRQLKVCYENLKRRVRKRGLEEKIKLNGELRAINSQIVGSSNLKQDSDLDSNSSTDMIKPLVEESNVDEHYNTDCTTTVPGSKLLTSSDTDAAAPDPGGSGSLHKLRCTLLRKEISLANLDLEMRARKYDLELRVQEAKLEYYQQKLALLAPVPDGHG